MSRLLAFSSRTAKEILRDPLNLCFGLGFPVVLLLLLTAIQVNVPVPLFELSRLTPGLTVFGFSFLSLFSAVLLAKDRESAFLQRLYTTPMKASDFICGYILPLLPMAAAQTLVCFGFALLLGLKVGIGLLYCLVFALPISLFYISLGLLCGSVLNSKQVGGICGALLTNLSAWLSGIWFDISLVGEAFHKISSLLPFLHAVELERAVFNGSYEAIATHLPWVLGYAAITTLAAVLLFLRQMKRQ